MNGNQPEVYQEKIQRNQAIRVLHPYHVQRVHTTLLNTFDKEEATRVA